MKKLLLISYSKLDSDPRVIRHYEALRNDFEVHTAGLGPLASDLPFELMEGEKADFRYKFHLRFPMVIRKFFSVLFRAFERLKKLFPASYYEALYWSPARLRFAEKMRHAGFDLVLANDIDTLPLALKIAGQNGKVIIDSHEYHPLEFEDNPGWMKESKPLADYLCRKYLPEADAMFTVCDGICEKFKIEFGVNPIVISNATSYNELLPSENSSGVRLVHHGIAIRARQIELMVDMMKFLDQRFTLNLLLMPVDKIYFKELEQLASVDSRIRFENVVPTHQIPRAINKYDVGLFLLPPVNFNYKHALPNKFFEFIQARLAIAVGPSPEMANLVQKHGLGIISENFSAKSMAMALNDLDADSIRQYKLKSHAAAAELSSKKNMELILNTALSLVD